MPNWGSAPLDQQQIARQRRRLVEQLTTLGVQVMIEEGVAVVLSGRFSEQAAGVKRADGCIAGAGWSSEKQRVNRLSQAIAADFISVAGHSLGLHQTPIEGRCSRDICRETVASEKATPEKLFCALMPVFSIARAVSTDTPRECQTRGRGSHETLGDGAPSR